MKFHCSVDINQPIDKVIQLWDQVENLKEWQTGFISYTHLSGEEGKEGAKARFVFKHGSGTMELIETIQVMNLPEEMTALYEHTHTVNTMTNRFTALSDASTRWTADLDYIKLNGFVIKVMAKLFPGMFKKQTQKWLDQFKAFAEKQG